MRLNLVRKLLEAGADATSVVPVSGVRDAHASGSIMDSVHYCFFKAQQLIGRMSRNQRSAAETTSSLLDARHAVQVEQSISNAIMSRMRLLAFSKAAIKQPYCIECGRAYRQHLTPFSNCGVSWATSFHPHGLHPVVAQYRHDDFAPRHLLSSLSTFLID